MKSRARSVFPRLPAEHDLLFRACTQSGPAAKAAWERWQEHCKIETADLPSQEMFGMVYGHLLSGMDGPEPTVLKGVYKRNWYANQMVLAHMTPVLESLAIHDIAVMVLNDVALVAGYYPDIGHRAIRCIDLLVHASDWDKSLSLAIGCGWHKQPGTSFGSPGALSATAFLGPEESCLRIWTNLFGAEPMEDTEARTWGEARNVELNGQALLSLGPVEQLLCLSAAALRDSDPPLHLYTDAHVMLKLLTTTPDWARLVWEAQRYECILPLRNLLAFLQQLPSVQLPFWVLPALDKMAISHFELLQYHRGCDRVPLRLKSACLRVLRSVRQRVIRDN